MRKWKKNLLIIAIVMLCAFVLLNGVWFVWRGVKYGGYSKNMEKTYSTSTIVPIYSCTDEDGYKYTVLYPNYLSFYRGISLDLIAPEKEGKTIDGLWISPLTNGKYKYSVLISEGDESYLMAIDAQGNCSGYSADDENIIVEKYKDSVSVLLKKANEKWNIKLTWVKGGIYD